MMNRLLARARPASRLHHLCAFLNHSRLRSSPSKPSACFLSADARVHATAKAKDRSEALSFGDAGEGKPPDYDPSGFDFTECRSPPSQNVIRIVDEIAGLTLLEASDLSYLLKKKLGLPVAAMRYFGGGMTQLSTMRPEDAAGAPEAKPEKTTFDLKLERLDSTSKMKIIKEVRAITSLGLKEAKDAVKKLPAILKKGVCKEEAHQIVETFKAVGATVVLE